MLLLCVCLHAHFLQLTFLSFLYLYIYSICFTREIHLYHSMILCLLRVSWIVVMLVGPCSIDLTFLLNSSEHQRQIFILAAFSSHTSICLMHPFFLKFNYDHVQLL